MVVLESSLLSEVAYRGALSGWPLDQTIQFDVVRAREFRRRKKNMATSQKANIFLPAALGGIDFRRLSDIIQKRKRATDDRLHESPLELRVAFTIMINRARRLSQMGYTGKYVDLWASSLLEYASLCGANLSQPAIFQRPMTWILENKLDQLPEGDLDVLSHLTRKRILKVGDITQWSVQQKLGWASTWANR